MDISDDIILYVFQFLSWVDVHNLCMTSKYSRTFEDSESYLHELSFIGSNDRRYIEKIVKIHAPTLTSLKIDNIPIGRFNPYFSSIQKLKKLEIKNTTIKINWTLLPELEKLYLNAHTNVPMDGIETLKHLKILHIHITDAHARISRKVSELCNLEYISVGIKFVGDGNQEFMSDNLKVVFLNVGYPVYIKSPANLIYFDDNHSGNEHNNIHNKMIVENIYKKIFNPKLIF
jgi:hypothetical protein